MAAERLSWVGLLKWSLSHYDGTRPARQVSEEERRWFLEAVQAQTVNVVSRLREIALLMGTPLLVLEARGITAADIEDLLEELQVHVESIDIANDLHAVGGLVPLLSYLRNSSARLRAKAADVVTTVVQNNPISQQYVMEASGFEPLLHNFVSDVDVTVRTKCLGALSSLIRNNKPGIAAFRLSDGYSGLRDALNSGNARFQRKALNLTLYLLNECHSDCYVFTNLGFPRLMMHLASSNDLGIREAALGGLLEIARDSSMLLDQNIFVDYDKLRRLLKHRIESIRMMNQEELEAAREEGLLVNSLWATCYHEPSTLLTEGLLMLPSDELTEELMPPDVASKAFDSPFRHHGRKRIDSDDNGDPRPDASPLMLLGS